MKQNVIALTASMAISVNSGTVNQNVLKTVDFVLEASVCVLKINWEKIVQLSSAATIATSEGFVQLMPTLINNLVRA